MAQSKTPIEINLGRILLDLYKSGISGLLVSALGAFLVPMLDNRLSDSAKSWITFAMSFREETRLLITLRYLHLFNLFTSCYTFCGVWHVIRFVCPILGHIRGEISNDCFFRRMFVLEWQMTLFFGPRIARRLFPTVWHFRSNLLIAAFTTFILWKLTPQNLRHKILHPLFDRIKFLAKPEQVTIRTTVMSATLCFSHVFDKQEIEIARRRAREKLPRSPYEYRPFQGERHIRLLVLEKRAIYSEWSCELIHVPLAEAPPFEALSYTWGTKPPSIGIAVDGKYVLVTPNVEEFLLHQRSVFGHKYFWIDAVCINQNDKDEKSAQIRLMSDIYRKASRVIVWLGLWESLETRSDLHTLIRSLRWPHPSGRHILIFPYLSNETAACKALNRLLSHPWFERMWIIQEVAVGNPVHVMTNGLCIEWEAVSRVANEIGRDLELRSKIHMEVSPKVDAFNPLIGMESPMEPLMLWGRVRELGIMRTRYRHSHPLPFGAFLPIIRFFKCREPVDKVFALLGICKDGNELAFKSDYHDTVDSVFLKATLFALSQDSWFMTLLYAGRGYEAMVSSKSPYAAKLPSWVADYASDALIGVRMDLGAASAERADNTGKVGFSSDPKVITLQFHVVEPIQYVGSRSPMRSSPSPILPNSKTALDALQFQLMVKNSLSGMKAWYLQARELALKHSTVAKESREMAEQKFWEACIFQGNLEETAVSRAKVHPSSSQARKIFELFLLPDFEKVEKMWEQKDAVFEGIPTIEQVMEESTVLMQRFAQVIIGRSFAISSSGMMAFVPPLTHPGDLIVQVRGGYAPLLVRPSNSKERVAELVGACSVRGVDDVYSGSDWTEWSLV